jgi:hypothetical protein
MPQPVFELNVPPGCFLILTAGVPGSFQPNKLAKAAGYYHRRF